MSPPAPGPRSRRDVAVLSVVYLALAFGWRSWLQWRRTGDAGFRLSRSVSPAARLASLLMIGGSAAAFAGAARGGGDRDRRRGAAGRTGILLLWASIVGTLKAQLDLGASWRVGVDEHERTQLVTHGAFALARNPIFTGMAVFALGTALAAPAPLTVLGAAAVLAGVEVQVRAVEEPYLLRVHGDAYRSYLAHVGRFLPGIGRGAGRQR